MRLVAVLKHGIGLDLYTITEEYKSGPNLTIELIERTILLELQKNGWLPPTLYIQLDNSSKDNKNLYNYFIYFEYLSSIIIMQL